MRREAAVNGEAPAARITALALAHLDAAHNLARWLTGNDQDARDVVQEAFLRAVRYAGSFAEDGAHGGDGRGWWLAVVRNTSRRWLGEQSRHRGAAVSDDVDDAPAEGLVDPGPAPDASLEAARGARKMHAAIARLPPEFREVLVLREMEDYSYVEIARIVGVPAGTVMSRLARARRRLRELLAERPEGIETHGL